MTRAMPRAFSAFALLATLWIAALLPAAATAQAGEAYWVQLSANATLREAEEDARSYGAQIGDVNGFRLGNSGWYAVVLGPYTADAATEKLIALRRQGAIPRDSYISDGAPYGQRFWPVGVATTAAEAQPEGAQPAAPAPQDPAPVPDRPIVVAPDGVDAADGTDGSDAADPQLAAPADLAPAAPPAPVEETRQEALTSERQLDGEGRRGLQIALQWEGFYRAGIDGDFGPGTRRAMTEWQAAQGYEETGVLTTRQRKELLDGYNAAMASIGLAQVIDPRAGIEITLPAAMVAFTRYEAPFAHYEGEDGVRVVLISQRGDRATLWGLYDILQTLAVVPPEGPRERRDNSFTIEGSNSKIHSVTSARLVDGAVKGWMLIWPQGKRMPDPTTGEMVREEDKRRDVVLAAMRDSFASLGDAALDANAGLDTATQSIDLVSGLEIRRPAKSRSGFYVTETGAVLTTTEAVAQCGRITLDEAYTAEVVARDEALGLALLQPSQALAPLAFAEFLSQEPRLQSELAVAGYSYGGRLSSPTLTYGTLAEARGLGGETTLARLEIRAQDGDTGGPVVDDGGAVIGMLLAQPTDDGRVLPTDVGFVAKGAAVMDFLATQGITASTTPVSNAMTPYDLSGHTADLTVLVNCWD